jgi:hypothetical protein
MENSITWVKDHLKSQSKSYIMGLGGLFGPTQVGFCTCSGRPTREGPFFLEFLESITYLGIYDVGVLGV